MRCCAVLSLLFSPSIATGFVIIASLLSFACERPQWQRRRRGVLLPTRRRHVAFNAPNVHLPISFIHKHQLNVFSDGAHTLALTTVRREKKNVKFLSNKTDFYFSVNWSYAWHTVFSFFWELFFSVPICRSRSPSSGWCLCAHVSPSNNSEIEVRLCVRRRNRNVATSSVPPVQ